MKLISYKKGLKQEIGSIENDIIVPFSQIEDLPTNMLSFLEEGKEAFNAAKSLCNNPKETIKLSDVQIEKPIARPPKIIAIGLNYADHLEEIKAAGRDIKTPEVPMIFNKQSLSANGPYDDIERPVVSDKLDYEGELTNGIGQKCRPVSKDAANKVNAG